MKKKIYFKTATLSLILQGIIISGLLVDIFLAVIFSVSYMTADFRSESERQFAIFFSVIFYAGIIPLT